MPLGEITTNTHRFPTANKHGFHSINETAEKVPQTRPPPLAVQNMLKRSTETGDEGMFAQRPPRVPRSSTQSSLGLQSRISASSSFLPRSDHRPYFDPNSNAPGYMARGSSRALKRNDTVRSSASAHRYHSMAERVDSKIGSYAHRRAYPLHSAHSATSLRSDVMAQRVPLPRQRPHRSARIPSPAVSNYYEYHLHPKSISSRHGSHRTSLTSPSPLLLTRQSHRGYCSERNISTVSLRSLPSPTVAAWHHQQPRQSILRSSTPVSVGNRDGRLESAISFGSNATSPTGSVVPFYYDYSESFHGRQALLPSKGNSASGETELCQDGVHSLHNKTAQAAQIAFDPITDSKLALLELSTKHNRNLSEHSARHSRKTSGRSTKSSLALSHEPIQEGIQPEQNYFCESYEQKAQVKFSYQITFIAC